MGILKLAIASAVAFSVAATAQAQQVRVIAANPQGSIFYAASVVFGKLMDEKLKMQVRVQPMAGSSTYIPMLDRGEADFGLTNVDDAVSSYKGIGSFRQANQNLRLIAAVFQLNFGILVPGVEDVLVRLAKCCHRVPGDGIVGYISLGRGITIHRGDCPNVKALMRNPERFTPVEWEGGATTGFRVQIAVEAWDRPRLLEDVARTFSEHGANIVAYGGTVEDQMARNWYTAEVGDIKDLRSLLTALRNVEAVFDAYRMTPQ